MSIVSACFMETPQSKNTSDDDSFRMMILSRSDPRAANVLSVSTVWASGDTEAQKMD